jgi:hypothetical protein
MPAILHLQVWFGRRPRGNLAQLKYARHPPSSGLVWVEDLVTNYNPVLFKYSRHPPSGWVGYSPTPVDRSVLDL